MVLPSPLIRTIKAIAPPPVADDGVLVVEASEGYAAWSAGEQCGGAADVGQGDDQINDAGVHEDVGAWVALKDAADHLGVSVDTVKRRMKRGELESRRETIPQGFRWLVRVDPAKTEAPESPRSDEVEHRDIDLPSESPGEVALLRAALEARTAEVASLLASVERLSSALEHAETRLHQLDAGTGASAPESEGSSGSDVPDPQGGSHTDDDQMPPETIWARLARWWKGG